MTTIVPGAGSDQTGVVLFVDDEAEALEEFAELFELLGFDVRTCASPIEAQALILRDNRIKVVVTDFRMAGLDGGALVRSVREQLPQDRPVRFIILTGLGAGFQLADLHNVPVLAKPFDLDLLLAHIRTGLTSE
jgi:CheY-like chemotaxis protein